MTSYKRPPPPKYNTSINNSSRNFWIRTDKNEIVIFNENLERNSKGLIVTYPSYSRESVDWLYLVEKDNVLIMPGVSTVFVLSIDHLIQEDVFCQPSWGSSDGIWHRSWKDDKL